MVVQKDFMLTASGWLRRSVYNPLGIASRATASISPTELWLLTAFIIAVQFAAAVLFPIPLSDPDETLFCVVAREMMATGDFITPRYQSEPFLDRPAFYYWSLIASVQVFGDSIFAYRFPSFLMGAGTLLTTSAIALRCGGPLVGASTALCLATMVAQVVISVAVGHDTALVFFSTAAIWVATRSNVEPPRASNDLAAGALMGLAVLSKGLLGIVIPGIAISWLDGTFKRRPLISWLRMFSIAFSVGSSWYLAVEWVQPGFLWYFFVERHLAGFLTNSQRHGGQSVLVYVPTLLLGGLPAIVFLIMPAREIARSIRSIGVSSAWKKWGRTPAFAIAGWLTTIILFFALAGSKNPTYMLPAFVPISIIAGVALASRTRDEEAPFRRLLWAATIVFASLLIVVQAGVLPAIGSERSAERSLEYVRSVRTNEPILWFNHVPPSARFHAPDFPIERVYYPALMGPPSQRTILITRVSRLEEVLASPFARHSQLVDPDGKYKILVCRPDP